MLKVIKCSGKSFEMGRQYGEQARKEIRQNLELFKIPSHCGMRDITARIEKVIKKYTMDAYSELCGIAQGANVDVSSLLFINHVDVLESNVERCTPVILNNGKQGIIVAKNNDSPPNENFNFVLRKCSPDMGLPFIQLTYAGWVSGLDMMNADGVANTHGSVGSCFDKSGERIDIRLIMYELMKKCRSVNDVYQQLGEFPLTGKGFNIALGDSSNQSLMLDAAIPFIAVSSRNKNFDYATNIYRSPGLEAADVRAPEKRDICVYRYGYLKWLEQTNAPKKLEDIKKLLSCHDPWAPCRHGGSHGSQTDWSMINVIKDRKILVADGAPCENEYKEYSL